MLRLLLTLALSTVLAAQAPRAQEYYDSVFELFASWEVDYVKVDDIARPYHE
jgi:hypothetical protein